MIIMIIPNSFGAKLSQEFDFTDTALKKKVCEETPLEYITEKTYNPEDDTCIFHTNHGNDVYDFKTFYCKYVKESWLPYSYIKDDCIYANEIFLYDEQELEEYWSLIEYDDSSKNWGKYMTAKYLQKLFSPLYHAFINLTKDKTEQETKEIGETIISLLDEIIHYINTIQNKNLKAITETTIKSPILLVKYEIKNHYLNKIYGCKWKYCFHNQKYSREIKLGNNTRLYMQEPEFWTFGCYYWKTMVEENGEKRILIESIDLWNHRKLCPVEFQVVDDDTIRIFLCVDEGAGSWECWSIVLNYNIKTKKLSFVGNWYYSFRIFSPITLKIYEEEIQKEMKEIAQRYEDIKYINTVIQRNQIIRNYFKTHHNLDIDYLEGDELAEFGKFLQSKK